MVFNAAMIAEHDDQQALLTIEVVARMMAVALGASNPRFDRQRFLKDCGVV